jgi:hypothetical protein
MVGTPQISQRAKNINAADAPRLLRLFNTKAEELNESPFIAAVRAGKVNWSAHWERDKGGEVVPNLPDEWDINGYVLPFRLFFQDRDGFSFDCLSQLYPKLDISNCLKVRADEVQGYVKRHMGALSPVILDGEQMGRQQIFDTLMYGGLAHVNEDKQPMYDKWASHGLQKILVYSEFVQTLAALTQAIFWMRRVNRDALQELEEQ